MNKKMKDLDEILSSLGGKSPHEFKQVMGTYDYGDFSLVIDDVPDDPTAMPVRLKVRVSLSPPKRVVSTRSMANGIVSPESNVT